MQYAYSIGCKYASGLPYHAGDDFMANVKSAANIYGGISGITSYYSTEPTYSYMRGNNSNGARKIASYIVFLNGHSHPELLTVASSDTNDHRTGVYAGNDTTMNIEQRNYTFAGLSSTNMSTCGLIIFAGCSTGAWPEDPRFNNTTNLPKRSVERGARVAVGFRNTISTRVSLGANWLNKFNTCIKEGYGIDGAITAACAAYPNSNLSSCAMAEGKVYDPILPINRATFADIDLKNQYYTIQANNIEIKKIQKDIHNENLSSYTKEFDSIIQKIKEQDSTFDIKDYRVTYNIVNEEQGFSHIYFTKYINDEIETNQVYLTVIKNGKIDNIILAGVTKENLRSVKNDIGALLESKINKFEQKKLNKIQENNTTGIDLNNIKIQDNKAIDKNSVGNNIEEVKEKYLYDYNTNELTYTMQFIQKCELGTTSSNEIEIEIE